VEVLGTYHSVWFGELARVADSSGLGELRELAIDFGDRRAVSARVGDRYYVVTVFESQAITGGGKAALAEACRRLTAEVE
jgi:predicted regulator of Ras-like GTPase activity (Roadblock/LC7/MglB family)